LLGSVPLADADQVFGLVSDALGARVRSVPDGETGDRRRWVGWQQPRLAASPQLQPIERAHPIYSELPLLAVRPGTSAADIQIGPLGYADAAIASYAKFAGLKARGAFAPDVRFQVSLPTPLAPVHLFMADPNSMRLVEPAYHVRLLAELQAILGAIPHHELAIQWDTVVEFLFLEGHWPAFPEGDLWDAITTRLARLGNAVPADVTLGFHFCYGDNPLSPKPADTGTMVRVARCLMAGLQRPLDWLHMPVPIERDDLAYFAPLADLGLSPGGALYLGLLYLDDGLTGAVRRIAAAQRASPEFGVAAPCGLGRQPPETVPDLVRLHVAASQPIR
jgi:hypothetical protein